MEKNLKQLLLKDLCARLPYGVRYKGDHGWGINPYQHNGSLCDILSSEKPLVYLRTMSSMTEEEKIEWDAEYAYNINSFPYEQYLAKMVDWLNAHHFDFRNLIEKGLALESPADMYKTE